MVFQHRHGSGARRAHHLLESGALGIPRVVICETLWYRPDSYFLPEWRGNWAGEGGGPTLGHGIHQIDLLLHLMGSWHTVDARAARIARPVEFEDVSLAIVMFDSGAAGTVVTSLLCPQELSRIRIDTTSGTLEVNHVYGYSDADWSRRPMRQRLPVWARSGSAQRGRGLDGGEGDAGRHRVRRRRREARTAVSARGRPHPLPRRACRRRPRAEVAGRVHAESGNWAEADSSVKTARLWSNFIPSPANRFYESFSGGLPTDTITARLDAGRL